MIDGSVKLQLAKNGCLIDKKLTLLLQNDIKFIFMKKIFQTLFVSMFFLQLSIAQTVKKPVYWGFFDESVQNNPASIDNYTKDLVKKPAIIMWYRAWTATGDKSFPVTQCKNLYKAGYIPHIVWEPNISFDDIIAGVYDTDLTAYAESIVQYGGPVMLRWGHEFNGDWYSWNAFPPATYIAAYKHVHDIVAKIAGKQASWIWCANNGNGGTNKNDIIAYYPGDDYVDWVGIDGYNWGTSQTWSSWSNFNAVFSTVYNKLATKYPSKPIMLGEFGCSSTGGDKVVWINDFFKQVTTNYKNLRAFVWFNISKETDWRFNTSAETTQAFANGLKSDTISGDATELENFMLNPTTSISDISGNANLDINVYPNPVIIGTEITVKLSSQQSINRAIANISDIEGRILFSGKLDHEINKLNISSLSGKGVYIMQIVSGNISNNKVLLVQ